MNDDKTNIIPSSAVNRAYIEAVEATYIEPTIIDNKEREPAKPFDASSSPDKDAPKQEPSMKADMSNFMPPISKTGEPLTDTTIAFKMLKDVGFTQDQAEVIRKAVFKKKLEITQYWWQFKTLFAAKFPNEMPICAEKRWQTICNLFDKATPAESEITDDINIPTSVKVKTVKPNQPMMRKMYGVSEGIEPTLKKQYVPFPRTKPTLKKQYVPFPRTKTESIDFQFGDRVEFIEGEHKGKAGQIMAVDDGPTWPAFGPKKFSVSLHEQLGTPQRVTCHECQVTKLSENTDFRRYDRVRLRYGSSKGSEGTVTRVNKEPNGFVFVMLDGQTDNIPAGFDAWKLEMIYASKNMPLPGEEVIYFDNGIDELGIIAAEYDNGDILVRFNKPLGHGPNTAIRVSLKDISRVLTWPGKDNRRSDLPTEQKSMTINTQERYYYKNVVLDNTPDSSIEKEPSNYDDLGIIVTDSIGSFKVGDQVEVVLGDHKGRTGQITGRYTPNNGGGCTLFISPHDKLGSITCHENQVVKPPEMIYFQPVIGCSEKQVEQHGVVTVDTRGIDPKNGKTELIMGECICDLQALMMLGCKCERVQNTIIIDQGKIAAVEVKNQCTCPTSVLMTAGCKCGSMKK